MKKRILSNKEIRKLNESISEFNHQFNKKDIVELIDEQYIRFGGKILFFYDDSKLYPTLHLVYKSEPPIKKVTVDMGAVKFVTNGADIMRPGVVGISEEIKSGESVAIVDERNSKALAVGIALYDSTEMREQKGGKVVKNLHFVGDDIWKG